MMATTETVTIPADVVLQAASTLYAAVRVATVVNDDVDASSSAVRPFDNAADRLMHAAWPTNDVDIDEIPEWREFDAQAHERAATLIESILAEGGPLVGRLLGLEQWHADREAAMATRDRKAVA